MKAISLHQPWATLIAIGAKQWETRSWDTHYRGLLAIHAAKRKVNPWEVDATINPVLAAAGYPTLDSVPLGCIVCVVDLVDVLYTQEAAKTGYFRDAEYAYGNFAAFRFAWRLDNVRVIDNIPAKGSQGFWVWNEDKVVQA